VSFSTFAQSNRAKLAYLAETVWAQTPTSGAPREMRIKTSKLALKKETKTSDEIRADRMIPSIIEVGAASEGEIDFEFSAGAIDDFLAAFVYGQWSRPQTMDFWEGNVSITANNTIKISSDTDYSTYLVVGRYIKTEGFTKPSNNNYLTISAVAFAGGVTTITTVESSLVAEAASAYTKLLDANDVFVKGNSYIRFGTGGASTIDSNGHNAFSAAIAAGQIKIGQKIHVDGAGFDQGTITYTAAAASGDTVTINDSVKQITLAAVVQTSADSIVFTPGADQTATVAALTSAINAAYAEGLINAVAQASSGMLTVFNLEAAGGSLSKTETGSVATVANFSGGDDSIRGFFTVTSVANDVLGVTPQPATNANSGAFPVTVKGSMLRNPHRPQDFVTQSFSIETSYEDVNQFFINKGLRVGQFDLNIASREIVTGKVNFKGEGMYRQVGGASLFDNSPYVSKVSTPGQVLSATTNVGSLTHNGVPLATAIKSITIQGDAALREQTAVGFKFPVGIGVGRFKLSGKVDAYFEDGALFDEFINHSTVSLGWDFTDLDQQHYFVTIPAVKFTENPLSPGSIDQDVMENLSWEAQRDPNLNAIIQFDRFSSTKTPSAAA